MSINIFCPNARRVQIKLQPTTKVLDIIEETCKRQGFDYTEYTLSYQKRTLDISLAWRLTGIAYNTTLDLQKLEKPRQFQDVIIVLQLPDGNRLAPKTFKPDTTDVLCVLDAHKEVQAIEQGLARTNDDLQIVCSFLNEQIIGTYQLKNTTLKDLGLLNGRGLIRFEMLKIEKDIMEKKTADFEQKIEKRAKLEAIYQKIKAEELAEQKKSISTEKENINVEDSSLKRKEPINEKLGPVKSNDLIQIIERPVTSEFSNFKFNVTKKQVQKPEEKLLEVIPKSVNEFSNFKFPEETKGKALNNFNELYEIEKVSKEACERHEVLICLDDEKEKLKSVEDERMDTDMPEDVFEVTLKDLKGMLGDAKKVQNEENVLMTRQMRELEQDKKAMKYPQIAIRVCFRDRKILQGIFRPKELASALYKFVAQNLSADENSKEDLDFSLYTTPPKKTITDMKKTLFELDLYPAAQVYFKNKSDRVPKFKETVSYVTKMEAREIVNTSIHQQIRNVEHEGMQWLQAEQEVLGKMLGKSGLAQTSNSRQAQPNSSRPYQGSQTNDATKKKLGLFLGKK